MAKLKVYTLGNYGLISGAIAALLDQPSHVRQAQVLIAATSKRAAVDLAEATQTPINRWNGQYVPAPHLSNTEFRQTMGNDVDALAQAGLLDKPAVLVIPLLARPGDWVVAVDNSGARRIGTLTLGAGRGYTFEPAGSAVSDTKKAADLKRGDAVLEDGGRRVVEAVTFHDKPIDSMGTTGVWVQWFGTSRRSLIAADKDLTLA